MKRISTLFFFMLLLASASSVVCQESVDSSRIVRVLSFNILHGETMRGDFDLEQIARVIRKAEPDLVAMQEVDLYTGRTSGRDLASELGLLTQMVPLFGRAMPYDGGEYGEGILSRYSFLSTRNHALPAQEGKEPRSALEVHVILKSGDTIAFVGTHFDHTGEVDRINQATELRDETRPLFWHFPHTYDQFPYSTVRKGDWKLIYRHLDQSLELYNINTDLSESHNLAGEEVRIKEELAALLSAYLREVNAGMPVLTKNNKPVPYPDEVK
jgi:endonuclease/exonuclease/phosphatase family metal-dependent hydrolase